MTELFPTNPFSKSKPSTPSLPVSRGPTIARAREIANGHTSATETYTGVIQSKNNAIELEKELVKFRYDVATAIANVDYRLSRPRTFAEMITDLPPLTPEQQRNQEAIERNIRQEAEIKKQNAVLIAQLNRATGAVIDYAAGGQVLGLVASPVFKKIDETVTTWAREDNPNEFTRELGLLLLEGREQAIEFAIKDVLTKIPARNILRPAANILIPRVGDFVAGAFAAADEYLVTQNISEAIVVGTTYARISNAAGAEAAAGCAASAAAVGSIAPGVGTFLGGTGGALTCDAIGSVAMGELYYRSVRTGVRFLATGTVEGTPEARARLRVQVAQKQAERLQQERDEVRRDQEEVAQQIALYYTNTLGLSPSEAAQRVGYVSNSLPVVTIVSPDATLPKDVLERTPMSVKLDGRRMLAQEVNRASADSADITKRNVTRSAEVYTYPIAPATSQPAQVTIPFSRTGATQ